MGVVKKTAQYSLLFLMTVQVMMGIAYIPLSVGEAQQFTESVRLFRMGELLVSDGYTGILYSILLWICHVLSGGAHAIYADGVTMIPFSAFISLFQLLMAGIATWYFLGVWMEKGWRRGFGTAFLLTVPFLLQLHLAVLPWSLALSSMEWMLGGLLRAKSGDKKALFALALGYLVCGLLVVELFWLCGLFLAGVYLSLCMKKIRQRGKEQNPETQMLCPLKKMGLVLLLVAVTGFTVNKISYVPQKDRMQNSLEASMVSRFVWPNFATNYYFWSDEIKEVMSLKDAITICQREDAVERLFGPLVEQKYGYEKAKKLYAQMAYQCLMDRTKEEFQFLAEDFRDYLLIPFTVEKNLSGEGTSMTAWNYGRMQEKSYQLVRYYVRYSFMVLPMMLLISLLLSIKQIVKLRFNKTLLGFGLWYGIWYTLASNKPIDYKLVLPVMLLWYLTAISGWLKSCEK